MKVLFIRLIRDSKGKPVLGEQPGDPNPIRVEPCLLGGAVPGYLVTYPGVDGQPARSEHIAATNVERAEVDLDAPGFEPPGLSVRPAMEASAAQSKKAKQ